MKEQLKKRKAKPVPTISVVSFVAELPVELYAYSITDTKDGFQHQFRLWTRGELEVASLMDANFVGLKTRRDDDCPGNEPLKDEDGYSRNWMIRYPTGNESTEETRKEGLCVLKDFFMSKQATDYPPAFIKTVDNTPEVPAVLESFLLDKDIEETVRSSFCITELDEDFYSKYPGIAKIVYLKKEPSDYAKNELGFPSLE